MYAPIPIRTEHHRVAVEAFCWSFVWTAELLGRLCPGRNPTRAAASWLNAYEHFDTVVTDVLHPEVPPRPICECLVDEPSPDCHKLSYQLEKRWDAAVKKRTRLYWPNSIFARCYGGRWLGSDRMPALHKASHDLLLSAVVLVYFAQDPAIFDSWTSERELEFRHRSGTYRGPIADGYVEIDGTPWLVEVGGLYGASMLKKKIEHAQRAGLNWNLW